MSSLKPEYSALKSKEFKYIYEHSEKFVGKFFVVFVLFNTNSFKVGFVASKKVGKAHERNRAKRLMREAVRINQQILPKNINLVMVARKHILNANFSDINNVFANFAKKFLKQQKDDA